MSDHAIVHVEIPAQNPRASADFYAKLFGWKTETDERFDYSMFMPSSGPGGGFNKIDGETTRPGDVLIYIGTDDIDGTLARAEELGGKILSPKQEIPETGWFAFFSDPAGNRIGLYTTMRSMG
jgi:predicted enzyme related to lactoylglutathione lyase